MMAEEDGDLFPDDGFMAMDNVPSFDSFDADENTPQNAEPSEPRYNKKKNDFNFTSLWRKPKLGRRKMKITGKALGAAYSGAKHFKDRESFETAGSVPLSDYDEAKDTVPFIAFTKNLDDETIASIDHSWTLKERSGMNPKLLLTPTPTKPKMLTTKTVAENSKPVGHNTDSDGFEILPKKSLSKPVEEMMPKGKDEGWGDLGGKENFFKDSFHGDSLYNDHGPILSSLSEDTTYCTHTSFLRGERFLDDHFNEAEGNDTQVRNSFGSNDQKKVIPLEPTPKEDNSNEIETSVRSFSDRLKLFQPSGADPFRRSKYSLNEEQPKTHHEPTNNILAEAIDNISSGSLSEIEIPAPSVDKPQDQATCDTVSEEHNVIEPDIGTTARTFGKDITSSQAERNSFGSWRSKSSDASRLSIESKISVCTQRTVVTDRSKPKTDCSSGDGHSGQDRPAVPTTAVETAGAGSEENSDPICCEVKPNPTTTTTYVPPSSNISRFANKFGGTVVKRRNAHIAKDSCPSETSEIATKIDSKVPKFAAANEKRASHESTESMNKPRKSSNPITGLQGNTSISRDMRERKSYIEKPVDIEPDETPVEADEADPKPEVLQSTKLNTSTDNIPSTAFVQSSANVFGVTLSSRRSRTVCTSSKEKLAATDKHHGKTLSDTTKQKDIAVEANNEEAEKKSIDLDQHKVTRKSIQSNTVERRTSGFLQAKKQPVVNYTWQSRSKGYGHSNKTDVTSADIHPDKQMAPSPEVKQNVLPKQKKANSLADRMMMFERASAVNKPKDDTLTAKPDCEKEDQGIEDTVSDEQSLKNVQTHKRLSFGDETVASTRRSTGSVVESDDEGLHRPSKQSNTLDKDHNDNNGECHNRNRRSTLKSTEKRFQSVSEAMYSKPLKHISGTKGLESKEEISGECSNIVETRRKTLRSILEEKKKQRGVNKNDSLEAESPTGAGYSGHKKYFENIDRSRVQSSIIPFVEQKQPIIANMSFQDDVLRDENGLPMFVTVEEDFMMREDNISTCLSASENRSVVCRPDALLYSVSQKAIALMSSKTEDTTQVASNAYDSSHNKIVDNNSSSHRRISASKNYDATARIQESNGRIEKSRSSNGKQSSYGLRYNRFVRDSTGSKNADNNPIEIKASPRKETLPCKEDKSDAKESTKEVNSHSKSWHSNDEPEGQNNVVPSLHFKCNNRFRKKELSQPESIEEEHLATDTKDKQDPSENKVDLSDEKPKEQSTIIPGRRFNHNNRFGRKELSPPESIEGNTGDKQDSWDDNVRFSIERKKGTSSHTFKPNRLTKYHGQKPEERPRLINENKTATIGNVDKPRASLGFDCTKKLAGNAYGSTHNRFARNKSLAKISHEDNADSKVAHAIDSANMGSKKSSQTEENVWSGNEEPVEPKNEVTISSMSIRERRMFFESQSKKN